MKQFMTAETGNVATNTVSHVTGHDGKVTFFVWGTFGGASVSIEVSPDGGTTWVATALSAFNAGSMATLEAAAGQYMFRANVTGGIGASLNAAVI